VQETIWNTSASTFTDIGTHHQVSDQGLRIGASLAHLGTQSGYSGRDVRITYDNVPGQNGDNGAAGRGLHGEFPVPILFRFGGMPFQLAPTPGSMSS
jgi:hypothetical protein